VPYIIALSALPVMLRAAGVNRTKYRTTMSVAMVAMLYSVYAIFAAGKDAVFGACWSWASASSSGASSRIASPRGNRWSPRLSR